MSYIDDLACDDEDPAVIDKDHVQRRVDDWLRRVTALYAQISAWADQNGWSHEMGASIPMNEEPLRNAGLPSREQPSLVMTSSAGERVWLKPKGLWVIGANGRVDIYTSKELLLLIDTARPFAPAHWVMHHLPSKPAGGQDFSPSMLAQLA